MARNFLRVQTPLEGDRQKTFIDWLRRYGVARYPVLAFGFAIPNGSQYVSGHRYAEAARQRALGLVAGVPDWFLPVAAGKYHGLFIEFKRTAKSLVSSGQADYLEYLNNAGYAAVIVYTAEQAIAVVEKYLRGELLDL